MHATKWSTNQNNIYSKVFSLIVSKQFACTASPRYMQYYNLKMAKHFGSNLSYLDILRSVPTTGTYHLHYRYPCRVLIHKIKSYPVVSLNLFLLFVLQVLICSINYGNGKKGLNPDKELEGYMTIRTVRCSSYSF